MRMTREDLAEAARRREEWLASDRVTRQRLAKVRDSRLRRHTIPLAGGRFATADLPHDLTPDEAERLAAMVSRLVVEVGGDR